MRVAHWTICADYRSGMAMTCRELVAAQKALGFDSEIINAMDPKNSVTDGRDKTETHHYAQGADLYVLHSHIPEPWFSDGTPTIVMLHGMPHYTWETEAYLLEGSNTAPFSQVMSYFQNPNIKRFVTMWSPQLATWDILDGYQGRTRFVQNGIDLDFYSLDGPKKKLAGQPVMLIADQARMCKDPFLMAFGAEWFRSHYAPEAQMHIVGMPPIGTGNRSRDRWENLLENSGLKKCCASRHGIVNDLPEFYRASDILLTSSPDESRVVKEAIALGMDVVSPFLNTAHLTEESLELAQAPPDALREHLGGMYCAPRSQGHQGAHMAVEHERAAPIWQTVNAVDAEVLAAQIAETWEVRSKDPDARRELLAEFARRRYDVSRTAAGMIEVYQDVMAETGGHPIIGGMQADESNVGNAPAGAPVGSRDG